MALCARISSAAHPTSSDRVEQERGISFNLGPSFYKPQSCFSRDLAALSAVVHRRQRQQQQQQQQGASPPPLHVLDLMAGSGVRSMRYLLQAGADQVLCNDGDPANTQCLVANLSAAAEAAAASAGAGGGVRTAATPGGGMRWLLDGRQNAAVQLELTHLEAVSLLMRCKLEGRFFDLIDSDSFGAAAHCVGAALDSVRYGGLLCLTHTAGTIAGGRDPASAQALYSQHLAPMPSANEQGLRMLLGLACREAALRRRSIQPLWSLYSPHGPVWRTMLLVDRQHQQSSQQRQLQQRQYGYVLHWPSSGESSSCSFPDLPSVLASAGRAGSSGDEPLLSGPLWLGPLHNHSHLQQVHEEAAARGWLDQVAVAEALSAGGPAASPPPRIPPTRKGSIGSLSLLLELLLEESAAEVAAEVAAGAEVAEGKQQQQQQAGGVQGAASLPPWYLRMNDVGRVGSLMGPPSRDRLAAELRRRGFVTARSHVEPLAIKTTASMAEAVAAAVEGLSIRSRAQHEP